MTTLLPQNVPRTISGRPARAELTPTDNSGAEVPNALTVTPTSPGGTRQQAARLSSPRRNNSPPKAARSTPTAKHYRRSCQSLLTAESNSPFLPPALGNDPTETTPMETTPTETTPTETTPCTGAPIAGIFDRITSEAHDQRLLGGSVPAALPETPHALQADQVTSALLVDPRLGLTESEAAERRAQFGPNLLKALSPVSELTLLLGQLLSPVVALLSAAMVLSLFFREWHQAVAIGVVLVINTTIGYLTERKAVRSVEALRAIGGRTARVRREGCLKRSVPRIWCPATSSRSKPAMSSPPICDASPPPHWGSMNRR